MSDIPQIDVAMAWALLGENPEATLIDVRTKAEWGFVGTPDLSSIGKQARLVEWIDYPAGARNASFVAQASEGLDPKAPVLLLCRSGVRSNAAAQALAESGFGQAINVANGFEGDLDSQGHRHGGWKDELPWRQQ
ncbi:MAG: rhodanese-like domain-containing protein [Actinomycetia bacterium]|nr:rhodanese-like domain-containing protein [Actinomycetes bacterium]